MGKFTKFVCTLLTVLLIFAFFGLMSDKRKLREEVIRLHVVGASDSAEDQAVKLQVRDGILAALEGELMELTDPASAKVYLQENLQIIEEIANETLKNGGFTQRATVTLMEEAFPVRHYDTFSLPSGVYQSLRVTIGEGEGKNWWCVVFPSLCLPAAGERFEDAAAGAGFSDELSSTLKEEQTYEVRFFLLDLLGKLENFFFKNR